MWALRNICAVLGSIWTMIWPGYHTPPFILLLGSFHASRTRLSVARRVQRARKRFMRSVSDRDCASVYSSPSLIHCIHVVLLITRNISRDMGILSNFEL